MPETQDENIKKSREVQLFPEVSRILIFFPDKNIENLSDS